MPFSTSTIRPAPADSPRVEQGFPGRSVPQAAAGPDACLEPKDLAPGARSLTPVPRSTPPLPEAQAHAHAPEVPGFAVLGVNVVPELDPEREPFAEPVLHATADVP